MIWAMPEFKHLLSHDGFPKKKSCDNLIYKHPKNCNFGEILFYFFEPFTFLSTFLSKTFFVTFY